jgi:hypothetical protein
VNFRAVVVVAVHTPLCMQNTIDLCTGAIHIRGVKTLALAYSPQHPHVSFVTGQGQLSVVLFLHTK